MRQEKGVTRRIESKKPGSCSGETKNVRDRNQKEADLEYVLMSSLWARKKKTKVESKKRGRRQNYIKERPHEDQHQSSLTF